MKDKEHNKKKLYIELRKNNINIIDTSYEIIEVLFNVNKEELYKKEREYINIEKNKNINNLNI